MVIQIYKLTACFKIFPVYLHLLKHSLQTVFNSKNDNFHFHQGMVTLQLVYPLHQLITLQQWLYRMIKRQNSRDGCALVSLMHKVYINVLYGNRLIMLEPHLYSRNILTEIADEPFMFYPSQVLSTPEHRQLNPLGLSLAGIELF